MRLFKKEVSAGQMIPNGLSFIMIENKTKIRGIKIPLIIKKHRYSYIFCKEVPHQLYFLYIQKRGIQFVWWEKTK